MSFSGGFEPTGFVKNAGPRKRSIVCECFLFCAFVAMLSLLPISHARGQDILRDLEFFGGLEDRSAGSEGAEKAAEYILKAFEDAGLSEIGVQKFLNPVPESHGAGIDVNGLKMPLHPWGPNLVYLSTTPKEGLRGPLVYVGDGGFSSFNEKPAKGAIILMDMASRSNWMHAAMLGAAALIYLGDEGSTDNDFRDKNTPTPVAFPRFWVDSATGEQLKRLALEESPEAVVTSRTVWRNKTLRNCYGFIPGKDPKQKNDLVIIDAFYDASAYVIGVAPGADEAVSIATLLSLVRKLSREPPDRSVLILATVGGGESVAGMREFIWALTSRRKILRQETKDLQEKRKRVDHLLDLTKEENPLSAPDAKDRDLLWRLIAEKAKDKADALTRESQYRRSSSETTPIGVEEDPRVYRRLSWLASMDEMSQEQKSLAMKLLGDAIAGLKAERKELKLRYEAFKSSSSLRGLLDEYKPVLLLSLHLSSHSPSIGMVEMGETYPVRENIKRMQRAGRLSEMLNRLGAETSKELGLPGMLRNMTRGSDENYGKPQLSSHPCCDVGAMAGLPAVSLMTMDDHRIYWGAPADTLEHIDKTNVENLSRFLPALLGKLFSHPSLATAHEGGVAGLASLEGQAKFIRQGELFPDQPAPGTIISVLQGKSIFRAMVFEDGTFFIPGLANNRVALEKLILEPYGIDPETGRVAWTADKVQTGKINYRIKVKSDRASTSLTMFHCLQTDVLQAFAPQNMGYLTKVDLLDALTEATPLRYWYSRVDGRDTMAVSVFLEKGVRFKLVMAQSLLSRDLFLLNGSPEKTTGKGFLIGDPPSILLAPLQAAKDLHLIIGERLENLYRHGIVNSYLQSLYETSSRELSEAGGALDINRYDELWKKTVAAWAKLDVIYSEIEKTQRDVLTGVMFFIALFVPFAYCMERYLFAFRGIYKQLTAFFAILVATIFVIKGLHPAFQLTYSPMVVIIAFFIVGLSFLVSWIIFIRFEREMALAHSRTAHLKTPQVSKWQSFSAGFTIGVSNLNRRKLRTALTCVTLIILTFTVMSFTNVKSLHRTTHTRIAESAPYPGILLRNQLWRPLTDITLADMKTRFGSDMKIWPRGWIEPTSSSERVIARIFAENGSAPVEGALGLGESPPAAFRDLLTHGRWFDAADERSVLLSTAMAKALNLVPEKDLDSEVRLFGSAFKVVGFFDAARLETVKDLDQNPLTPAYLETGRDEELSEVEIEAMQSGEELLPTTERFRYAAAERTAIMPFSTCMSYGGVLKAVTILPGPGGEKPLAIADKLSTWLAFPLFVGDGGLWHHSAGTAIRYSGVSNLLVPILIVVFITLNTMIGHVHERRKEIGTYTSVGLAPTHVGFLFIVEALSLATISTVIGYILAQLSAKHLANTALFSQLTFNYSSLASVACMFLVFSVVFLASLYPARTAAEIAMPDVNRSWTLPPAQGDTILMNLPFLLKYDEEKGIMGFLNEFYTSHSDTTHGSFIVDETQLDVDSPISGAALMPAPVCLLIRTNVWLAPFDFGIKQRIHLHCCPSPENPGYLEIAIQMIRVSGEKSAWERANRNFIKALRKQMLLWRLLDQEAKGHYQQLAPVDYMGQLRENPL